MYDFSDDGNPDGMFSIDRFSGWVRLAKPLDHEQRNHYVIGLRVSTVDLLTCEVRKYVVPLRKLFLTFHMQHTFLIL